MPLLVPENAQKREEKTVHAATENVTYGDVNSDGKINVLDMIYLKSYLINGTVSTLSKGAADLDADGKITSSDVLQLSMYLINAISVFQTEKNIDSDGDGPYDYQEKILGTDSGKKDTDGDGLYDYTEAFLSLTDPLSKDTGNAGVSDDKS